VIHDLRHCFVSDAHDAGLSAGVIMAHTGHVQEPTMLRYLRVSAPAQQRAQEQLDAYRRKQAALVAERAKKVTRLAGRRS
jgi:integrase